MQNDLSAAEILAETRAIKESIDVTAYVSVGISASPDARGVVQGVCYPDGVGGRGNQPQFYVYADTFREVLKILAEGWAERAATYRADTIKKMAVSIIQITYELGECSDNALRGAGFDASEVKRFSGAACEMANSMAERGPFTVLTLNNSNEAAR